MKKLLAALIILCAPMAFAQTSRDFIRVDDDDLAPTTDTGCTPEIERVARSWRSGAEWYCDDSMNPPRWRPVDSLNSPCARGVCFADKLSTGGDGTYSDPFVGWDTEFVTEFAVDYSHLHFPARNSDITYYAGSLVVDSTLSTGNFVLSGAGRNRTVILSGCSNTPCDGSTSTKRILHVDLTGVSQADRRSHMTIMDLGFEQKIAALASGGSIVTVEDCLRLDIERVGIQGPTGHCDSGEENTVCVTDADCTGTCFLPDLTSNGIGLDMRGPVNYGRVEDLQFNGKDETAFIGTCYNLFESVPGNVGPMLHTGFYANRCTNGVVIHAGSTSAIVNNVDFSDWKIVANGAGNPVAGTKCFDIKTNTHGVTIERGLCEGTGSGIVATDGIDDLRIISNAFAHVRGDGASAKGIDITTTGSFKRYEGLEIVGNKWFGFASRCNTGTCAETPFGGCDNDTDCTNNHCSVTTATSCTEHADCPSGETCVFDECSFVDTGVSCNTNAHVECYTGTCSISTTIACNADSDCPASETCNTGAPVGSSGSVSCNVYDEGQTCIYVDAWQVQNGRIHDNYIIAGAVKIHPIAGCTRADDPSTSQVDPILEDDTPNTFKCASETAVTCSPSLCPGDPSCECTDDNDFCVYNSHLFRYENMEWDSTAFDANDAGFDGDRQHKRIINNVAIGDGSASANPTIWWEALDKSRGRHGKLEYDVANHVNPRLEWNKEFYVSGSMTSFGQFKSINAGIDVGDSLMDDLEVNSLRLFRSQPETITLSASGELDLSGTRDVCRGSQNTTCTNDYDCAHCSVTTTTWCEADNDCPTNETCINSSYGVCEQTKPLVKTVVSNSGAEDTLEIITGGANGDLMLLRPEAGDTIIVQDTGNGGDAILFGERTQDCILDAVGDSILLMRTAANQWLQIGGNCQWREQLTQPIALYRTSGLTASDDLDDIFYAQQDWDTVGMRCYSDDATSTFNVNRDATPGVAGGETSLLTGSTCTCNGAACSMNTGNKAVLAGYTLDFNLTNAGTTGATYMFVQWIYERRE